MAARQLNEFMRHLRRVLDRQDAGGITDSELVKRYVQQRDQAAFEALLRRHGRSAVTSASWRRQGIFTVRGDADYAGALCTRATTSGIPCAVLREPPGTRIHR